MIMKKLVFVLMFIVVCSSLVLASEDKCFLWGDADKKPVAGGGFS